MYISCIYIIRSRYPQTPLGYSRAYVAKTGPPRPAPENKKPAASSRSSRSSSSSAVQDGCPVPSYPPAPPPSAGEKDAAESSGPAQTPRPPSFSETQREKQLRRERSKTTREAVGTRTFSVHYTTLHYTIHRCLHTNSTYKHHVCAVRSRRRRK